MEHFDKSNVENKLIFSAFSSENQIKYFKKQNYIEIKKSCLSNGKLFEDTQFPPSNHSIYYSRSLPKGITWMRASEIVKNPKFIVNSLCADDLDQGYLGNCW
jgi:hypothetical protein